MNDSQWERSGAIGGVVFVLLLATAGILGGEPPATSDSADEVTAYLAGHVTALQAGVWLLGLGVVALIWWFGSLWRLMARAEGGNARLAVVSLIGLALAGPLALTSAVVWATAAARIDEAGESAPFFYTLGAMLLAAEGFGLATHLLAANLLVARTGSFPRWLVFPGFLAALAFLVSAVLSASDVDVNSSLGLAGFVLWCAWILGISYCFWRDPGETRAGSKV